MNKNNLEQWQLKHHVSDEAMKELAQMFIGSETKPTSMTRESHVMDAVRVEASKQGNRLWRNNIGAGMLPNGSFVRWGLGNEAGMNKIMKSADLIGIKRVLITQEMIGTVIGQFYSVECKTPSWNPKNIDKGQLAWAALVNLLGGCAEFNNTGVLK